MHILSALLVTNDILTICTNIKRKTSVLLVRDETSTTCPSLCTGQQSRRSRVASSEERRIMYIKKRREKNVDERRKRHGSGSIRLTTHSFVSEPELPCLPIYSLFCVCLTTHSLTLRVSLIFFQHLSIYPLSCLHDQTPTLVCMCVYLTNAYMLVTPFSFVSASLPLL